jgi:hypothetical protein
LAWIKLGFVNKEQDLIRHAREGLNDFCGMYLIKATERRIHNKRASQRSISLKSPHERKRHDVLCTSGPYRDHRTILMHNSETVTVIDAEGLVFWLACELQKQ